MELSKSDTSDLRKKHFAKLHEKIQSKFDEMQKKLEKTRSVDSLISLNGEYLFKNGSLNDISELYKNSIGNSKEENSLGHVVAIENVPKYNASLQEIDVTISESELGFTPIEHSDDFSRGIDSLNETHHSLTENLAPPTQSPRIGIKNTIGSRIFAAKEKRQQARKERIAIKDKKKESREKVEKFVLSNTTKQDVVKKNTKLATVTIALIDVDNLQFDNTEDKSRMLYCRFRLGAEKCKSKHVKTNKAKAKWQELFNLNLIDEFILEISLWDKDILVGRSTIDLTELEKEKTHRKRIVLEGGTEAAQIFMLLTISGTMANTLVDLDDYEETQKRLQISQRKYAWYHFENVDKDVGWLSVIAYGAKGLSGSDCCCILELDNERLQTHADYKTSDPNWMKIFTLKINDITSILEVTVHDEKKSEDIGKLSIPLLNIRNGEKKWYTLKDETQRERAKGHNPRILLEMRITWNLLKASARVIHPKETKYIEVTEKLDRHIFARNLSRAKAIISWSYEAFIIIKTLFEWESRKSNAIALTLWLLFWYFFKQWMVPLLLLVPFLWYRPSKYYFVNWKKRFDNNPIKEIEDSSKHDKDDKSTSLMQKINSLQEMVQSVQSAIGKFASLGESLKNLFNFTVPFVSFLAIFFIIVIAIVMFVVPVTYIFMFWGVHKFTKKILQPNRIANNELLDLLSRVPDDETLQYCKELPLEEVSDEDMIK